jgi:hypothetical protein
MERWWVLYQTQHTPGITYLDTHEQTAHAEDLCLSLYVHTSVQQQSRA